MADMNIRNVPDEQMRGFKAAAVDSGVSLREWVLGALQAVANGCDPKPARPGDSTERLKVNYAAAKAAIPARDLDVPLSSPEARRLAQEELRKSGLPAAVAASSLPEGQVAWFKQNQLPSPTRNPDNQLPIDEIFAELLKRNPEFLPAVVDDQTEPLREWCWRMNGKSWKGINELMAQIQGLYMDNLPVEAHDGEL